MPRKLASFHLLSHNGGGFIIGTETKDLYTLFYGRYHGRKPRLHFYIDWRLLHNQDILLVDNTLDLRIVKDTDFSNNRLYGTYLTWRSRHRGAD